MTKPKVLIPNGLGFNSEKELGYVFELAGAEADIILLQEIIANPSMMDKYQLMGWPGGFTAGDQLTAGQSIANRINDAPEFKEKLQEKVENDGFPMSIICNSFQVFGKLGMIPGGVGTAQNDTKQHETQCWDLEVNANNGSIWTDALKDYKDGIFVPISHGEGRVYFDPARLQAEGLSDMVALRYVAGKMSEFYASTRGERYNPNGSVDDVAGLAWKNNLVLFPHFERLHHNYQRPDMAQLSVAQRRELYEPTRLLFKAAVDCVK